MYKIMAILRYDFDVFECSPLPSLKYVRWPQNLILMNRWAKYQDNAQTPLPDCQYNSKIIGSKLNVNPRSKK